MAELARNLATFFEGCVERSPDSTALHWKDGERWRQVAYGTLGDRARSVARGLVAGGIRPGDRILLASGTCLEWLVATWGSALAGGVVVPVSPLTPLEEMGHICQTTQPGFLFAEDPEVVQRFDSVWVPLKKRVAVFRKDCSVRDSSTGGGSHLRMEDLAQGKGRVLDMEQLARQGAFHRGRGGELLPGLSAEGNDVALVVHTPGTDGRPKGVMLSHAALLYSVRTLAYVLPVGPADLQLLFLPISHVLGLVSLLASHASGTPVALGSGVRSLLEDLRDIRPTYMVGVPRIYEKIVEKIDSVAADFTVVWREVYKRGIAAGKRECRLREAGGKVELGLRVQLDLARRTVFQRFRELFGGRMRFVISGGAPLSEEVGTTLEALGIPVLEGFGLTETSGATHLNRLDSRRVGTVGPALPMVETRIAPDGEILIKTPGLMSGYLEDAEGTSAALDDSGWLHTGDLGAVGPEGLLRITGRKKNLIVTATGENVVPSRLEAALEAIPLVSRCVVVGDLHSYLVALVTLNDRGVDRWALERGLEERSKKELRSNPDLYQEIERGIDRVNQRFAPHERVRRFAILDTDFSREDGELTDDLKVRRGVILARYRRLVDMLYEDKI